MAGSVKAQEFSFAWRAGFQAVPQSLNAFEGGWLAGGESQAGAPASPMAELGPPTSSPGAGPNESGPDQGLFSANQVWKGRMMLLPAVASAPLEPMLVR